MKFFCVFIQQSCPWSFYLGGVHTGDVQTACKVQWWTHLLSFLLLVCENRTKLSHRWHFLEMKYLSNIDFTVSYVIVSSSVNVNDFRISSASSPIQYISQHIHFSIISLFVQLWCHSKSVKPSNPVRPAGLPNENGSGGVTVNDVAILTGHEE